MSSHDDPDIDEEGEVDVEWSPVPKGLLSAWQELMVEEKKKPVAKARSRHPITGYGHRDNLKPDMTLHLRKAHCRPDSDPYVRVKPDGKFSWNGVLYKNGNQLFKAITGKDRHALTVRRYFALGGERSSALENDLRNALMEKAVVAKRGDTIYLTGELSSLGVPDQFIDQEGSSVLSVDNAKELLAFLNGDQNG